MKKTLISVLVTIGLGASLIMFINNKLVEDNKIMVNEENIKALELLLKEQNDRLIKTTRLAIEIDKDRTEIKEKTFDEIKRLNEEIENLNRELINKSK